ncbi:hypothetical protein DLAC_03711 [Tieghemostelium lacteum]|uniref:DUF4922 domain-containing protein n=1 Tax=Tieghemostelium lacteum TaxID=361077 RepID=A0A152A0X0_TIELA|nr:hypothetical protein DLAC_03711 [Tieghemostelium lacteum]|eukprot:KYQ99766.1 hypothetical protein DLAC_03711 [Tieghemostelium lacteum]
MIEKEDYEKSQEIIQQELLELIEKHKSDPVERWRKPMEHLYQYSCTSGYIQEDRLKLNIIYPVFLQHNYGKVPFQVTINCSKPEIIAGVKTQSINYLNYQGQCVICFENIGSQSRKGLRCFEFQCNGKQFFRQFPPYPYFQHHNIIIDREHRPQLLARDTIKELLMISKSMPGYKVASNSDKEGTGVTNLSHRHYQSGDHQFSVYFSDVKKEWLCDNGISVQWLHYPCCCLRIVGKDQSSVEEVVYRLFITWKTGQFNNLINDLQTCSLISCYDHITGDYEFLFFPRNAEQPRFLTRPLLQCIKKEFVGIFELCGFAILPVRLKVQLEQLSELLSNFHKNHITIDILQSNFQQYFNPPDDLVMFKEWIKKYYLVNYCNQYQKESTYNCNVMFDTKSILDLSVQQTFIDILTDNSPISPSDSEGNLQNLISQSNIPFKNV